MDPEGERQGRLTAWIVGGLVIVTLTSVSSFAIRLLVGFALAAAGARPWVVGAAMWIVTGAVLVTVIVGWRSLQRAAREEEERGR